VWSCVAANASAQASSGTQIESRCAKRTPIGRSKSEGRREVRKALEGNVLAQQRRHAARDLTDQCRVFAHARKSQRPAYAVTRAPLVACPARARKSSSCNKRGSDSRACTAWSHNISGSAGQVSWQTCSLRIAGVTRQLPQPSGVVSCRSSRINSRGI
jgi:hypothetical protein